MPAEAERSDPGRGVPIHLKTKKRNRTALTVPAGLVVLAVLAALLAACTRTVDGSNGGPPTQEPAPPIQSASAPPPAASPSTSPSPTPSPESTPEPTPEPSPEPTPVRINEKNDAFFDGSLFIGDSILAGISLYVMGRRAEETTLGNAAFLTSEIGISISDLVGDRDWGNYYVYGGRPQPLEDIVSGMEVRRIFLLLGLNDLAGESNVNIDTVVERYFRLIGTLRELKPEAEIVVITIPPKSADQWLPDYTENRDFGNPLIEEFAQKLIAACEAAGVPYIDMHAAFSDENGALPEEYCSDNFIHLNEAGRKAAVDLLYTYARDKGD